MKIEVVNERPNLPKRLFWEYRFDAINWDEESIGIIERVIERGTRAEWNELIRFYGYEKVVITLKDDSNYLADETIIKVCAFFQFKPEELNVMSENRGCLELGYSRKNQTRHNDGDKIS